MIKFFGETGAATSTFISTTADLCLKIKKYEEAEDWLNFKVSRMFDRYEKTKMNLPAVAMAQMELAEFYFATNDNRGEEALEKAMNFADDCSGNMIYLKLYRDINRIAEKYLPCTQIPLWATFGNRWIFMKRICRSSKKFSAKRTSTFST